MEEVVSTWWLSYQDDINMKKYYWYYILYIYIYICIYIPMLEPSSMFGKSQTMIATHKNEITIIKNTWAIFSIIPTTINYRWLFRLWLIIKAILSFRDIYIYIYIYALSYTITFNYYQRLILAFNYYSLIDIIIHLFILFYTGFILLLLDYILLLSKKRKKNNTKKKIRFTYKLLATST